MARRSTGGGRMNTEDNEKLLNDRDVAAILGVSEGFVRNGGLMLPYVKIGRTKRTRLSDLRKLIEARTVTKRRVKRPNGVYEEVDLSPASARWWKTTQMVSRHSQACEVVTPPVTSPTRDTEGERGQSQPSRDQGCRATGMRLGKLLFTTRREIVMATSASNFTPNLTPSHRFANPRVNKTEVRREIALFHDQYRVLPTIDGYVSHAQFVERVIPTEPAVYLRSADVPLFIAARLRSAPLSDAALKQHRERQRG